jgi:hypothetical protein
VRQADVRAEPVTGRRLALAAGVAFACTLLLWFRTDHLTPGRPEFGLPWDHHMYIFMAQHGPFSLHVAPYGWRVLVPALVWASPFGAQTGFEVLTFVAIWLTGVVIWVVCVRLGFLPLPALGGVLLYFSLGYATKWLVFDFWLTDQLAILAVAVAVLLALEGRAVAFALCLAIGVMAKESVIFAAPLLYTLQARRSWDPNLAARTVGATVPAVAVLVALHLGIGEMNGGTYPPGIEAVIRASRIQHYSYGSVLHDTVLRRYHSLGRTIVGAVGAFGLLVPLLAFFGLRSRPARSFGLRVLPFLVLDYVQLLFAYNTERLLVLAAPVVIPLAVWGLAELVEWRPDAEWVAVALPGAFFAMQVIAVHQWEPIWPIQLGVIAIFVVILRPWAARAERTAPSAAG